MPCYFLGQKMPQRPTLQDSLSVYRWNLCEHIILSRQTRREDPGVAERQGSSQNWGLMLCPPHI